LKLETDQDVQDVYLAFCRFLGSVQDKRYVVIERQTIEMLLAIHKILNSAAVTLRNIDRKIVDAMQNETESRQN